MKSSGQQLLLLPADVRRAIAERELRRRAVVRGGPVQDDWRRVLPFFRSVDMRSLLELLGPEEGPGPGIEGSRSSAEQSLPADVVAAIAPMLRVARANMDASLVPDEQDPAAPLTERWPRYVHRRDNGQSKPAMAEAFEAVDRLLIECDSARTAPTTGLARA